MDLFFPFEPIKSSNEKFFAGRLKFLERALKSLQIPGSCLIIYGDRQIGKSSFSNQLVNFLVGRSFLHHNDQLKKIKFEKEPCCVNMQAASNFKDINGVLAELIISEDKYSLYHFFKDVFDEFEVQTLKDKAVEWQLKFYGVTRTSKKNHTYSDLKDDIKSPDIIFDFFKKLIHRIHEKYPNKDIIIVIDEFDLLDEKKGMGELMKQLPKVHFVIVGIAENFHQLVTDHKSAEFKLQGNTFKLPLCTLEDVKIIFANAEKYASFPLKFDEEFVKKVFDDSGGLPGYAHLIGYHSLLVYKEDEHEPDETIGVEIYEKAIQRIFNLDLYDLRDNFDQENFAQLTTIFKGKKRVKNLVETLAEFPSTGIAENDLFEMVEEDTRSDFDGIITDLCNKEFLRRVTGSSKVKFVMPLTRQAVILANKYAINLE